MSDPLEAQASGGGEGSTPSPALSEINAEEIKPVEAVIIEAKKDNVVLAPVPETAAVPKAVPVPESTPEVNLAEVKPAEVSIAEVKPAEVKPAEVKPAEVKPAEVKAAEVKPAEVKPAEEPKAPVAADVNANRVEVNGAPQDDWQKREQELLKKIEELETFKTERSEDALRLELKVREEEIDLLKARVKNLETELQAALSKPSGKNSEMINNIKQQHEELLSKARGMIFDKTKMVKNQELQIEALTTQVQSLKDINQITKDLLEIRNSEVKAMEDRFQAMDARFKAEKERYSLVLQRAQTSTNVNDDLKMEYETQLAIFKELRSKYEIRVQALVEENNRLKASISGTNIAETGGPSTS